MEFVVGEVIDGAEPVRNLAAADAPTTGHRAVVQTGIYFLGIAEENLRKDDRTSG